MALEFYKCAHCGNVAVKLFNSGVPLVCCGEPIKVAVGSVAHPMEEEHYITMIVLETEGGFQVADLKPGMAPEAEFVVAPGDKAVAVYEYCNLHGLWKTEL